MPLSPTAEHRGLLLLTEQAEPDAEPSPAFAHQLDAVKNVFTVLRQGQTATAVRLLQAIPHRSAFRNCRLFLKAALALPRNPQASLALLAKIPADSPYFAAARLLAVLTARGAALVRQMLALTESERQLIADLFAFTAEQRALLDTLAAYQSRLDDDGRFDLAVRFQTLFGLEAARAFGKACLLNHDGRQRNFDQAFGPLPAFEQNRLRALALERRNDWPGAHAYWRLCIRELRDEGNDELIVSILKHLAANENGEDLANIAQEILIHNPNDKDCYLKILAHCKHRRDHASYRAWLDQALGRFPNDPDCLREAMTAAAADPDPERAVSHARALLRIDPHDGAAGNLLFNRHLASARRLLRTQRYAEAEAELKQAEPLKTGGLANASLQLLRLFARRSDENDPDAVRRFIAKTYCHALPARFQISMEALLSGIPPASAVPPAAQPALTGAAGAGLEQFLKVMAYYRERQTPPTLLLQALTAVESAFGQALAEGPPDQNLLFGCCRCFADLGHFDLLRHCAQRIPPDSQNPLGCYYAVYAQTRGDAARCTVADRLELERQLAGARSRKDEYAATLLADYLARHRQAADAGLAVKAALPPVENGDPLAGLFDLLADDSFRRIDKKAERLSRQTPPEQLVRTLGLSKRQQNVVFKAIMRQPDLLTALLFLRAAQTLAIDTGISVHDVLNRFGIDIV